MFRSFQRKKMETPISRHMGPLYGLNQSKMQFFTLEYTPRNERGGDNDRFLLQREARWIHNLSDLKHPCLNEALSYKSFL